MSVLGYYYSIVRITDNKRQFDPRKVSFKLNNGIYKNMDEIMTLAQQGSETLNQGLGYVVSIIRKISIVLFFAALVISGVMYTTGKTDAIKYGLVGSAIGGLAWLIVTAMFGASGADTGITLPNF